MRRVPVSQRAHPGMPLAGATTILIGSSRAGLALPITVLVLAIAGMLMAGTAFIVRQESVAAMGSLSRRLALEAAEYGAVAVLRDWNSSWTAGMPVGSTAGPLHHSPGAGTTASVRLTRVSHTLWWVVSEGRSGAAVTRRGAKRMVNAVLRLDVAPESASATGALLDSLRKARLAGARPIRIRDRWWAGFR